MDVLERGIKGLNDMELGDNARMSQFKEYFHVAWANDLKRTCCDSLESVVIPYLHESHV